MLLFRECFEVKEYSKTRLLNYDKVNNRFHSDDILG